MAFDCDENLGYDELLEYICDQNGKFLFDSNKDYKILTIFVLSLERLHHNIVQRIKVLKLNRTR